MGDTENKGRGFLGRAWFWAKIFCMVFTVAVLIVAFTPIANRMAASLVAAPEIVKSDIIVVLGGGAYPNGSLGGASGERLIRGLLLLKDGYAPRILFSGGTISDATEKIFRSVTGGGASSISVVEADIMRNISLKLGISPLSVDWDAESSNTYENLKNAKHYMAKNGLGTCLIVTSSTHMTRAAKVAKKLGMNCRSAPVDDYTAYRTSAVDRLALFHECAWEYAGLVLYGIKGYI